jgi:membrane dipeptidase
MTSGSRRAAAIAAMLLALTSLGIVGCALLERTAEEIGNPASTPPPYTADASAQALHNRLFVADMHADTLLSARDPAKAAGHGHLDLPRLRAGHVGIQVFSIVTNMPLCPGSVGCARSPNLVALLVAAQGWPIETWADDKARALYQAAKLRRIASDPAAGLALLENADDLAHLLSKPLGARPVGAVLAVEGAQAVGDDIAGVDELANAGVRMLGLAHFFDNAAAGSAHGVSHAGLTPFGRQVVRRALARGMIIDLAHASPAAVDDFLDGWSGVPFVVSHTGLRSVCNNARNLTDAQVRRIVRAGGLIGIGAWDIPLCLTRADPAARYVERMVKSIRRAIELADSEWPGRGENHIALGSDFDGWVTTGFDAGGWPLLTEGLLREGLPESTISRIMGGNVCRLLLRGLPRNGPPPRPELCGAG